MSFRFELLKTDSTGARAGILHTRRGAVPTPTFMPVATHANNRNLAPEEIEATGARILLANTYHLMLKPGAEVFERFGGIHNFMGWPGLVLTDSGGFQIFSLPADREITEKGAHFRSFHDNSRRLLSPEVSIATQQSIGSDIMMVLDVCIDSTTDETGTREAMERTHRWALRSLEQKLSVDTGQVLFAIVQGGVFSHLRTESAQFLTQHPFEGFAIGGLAVGETRDELYAMCGHTARLLPEDKPRYLMGVGTPKDLIEAVKVGVDMFDCIIPTKMAQQGYAYTFAEGQVRITRQAYRLSDDKLEAGCDCPVCTKHSRGYLQHLMTGKHTLGSRLLSVHNIHHFQRLMQRAREAIMDGDYGKFYAQVKPAFDPPRTPPPAPRKQEPPAVVAQDGDFELITLRNGSRAVRHRGHGEVMHPSVGPWAEANRLYVEQGKLVELLQQPNLAPLVVLDVGLGAATNAVAALACARNLGERRQRPLEVISFEHDLAPLRLALADPEGFPYLIPWREPIAQLISTGEWEGGGLRWTLHQGDAFEALGQVGPRAEQVYFDPFSPETNPALWTRAAFSRVREACRPEGALLLTYSASTRTRVTLLLAGFHVGQGVSVGTKQETTVAATAPGLLAQPLGPQFLERWQRSSAKEPHGEPLTESLVAQLKAHPQLQM
jgi:queuine tRNA-ribosyltransferase